MILTKYIYIYIYFIGNLTKYLKSHLSTSFHIILVKNIYENIGQNIYF